MKFYTREQIEPIDMIELICLWEIGAGEAFFDYCTFHTSIEHRLVDFLRECYPSECAYILSCHEDFDWIEDFGVDFFECERSLERYYIGNKDKLDGSDYIESLLPLVEFIWLDDAAWRAFEEFFVEDGIVDDNEEDVCYLQCFDIKEKFDQYLKTKENENE